MSQTTQRVCCEQKAAVRLVAQRGGLIALGSDAGSGGVSHVLGARREHELLALPDDVLARGAQALMERFPA